MKKSFNIPKEMEKPEITDLEPPVQKKLQVEVKPELPLLIQKTDLKPIEIITISDDEEE